MFPSIFIKRRDDKLLPFLKMFCKHKRAKVAYRERGYEKNILHIRIFYCPDCHKYCASFPTTSPTGVFYSPWRNRPLIDGDVSEYVYVYDKEEG